MIDRETYRAIAREYGRDYILRQLAEECTELAHAALKTVRAMEGTTPETEEECLARIVEEYADTQIMLAMCGHLLEDRQGAIGAMREYKETRMRQRLLEKVGPTGV